MVWTSAEKHSNISILSHAHLQFTLSISLYVFPVIRNMLHKLCYIKTRPKVKFSLYLKKAGLASWNKVHLQKNHSTLCRFLPLYSTWLKPAIQSEKEYLVSGQFQKHGNWALNLIPRNGHVILVGTCIFWQLSISKMYLWMYQGRCFHF